MGGVLVGLSQSDRILLCLMQGGWWSTAELLREVPAITHSRIADLRARGLTIEHRTIGKGAAGSQYRLVALGPATDTADVAGPSAPLSTGEPRRGSSGEPRPSDARPLVSSPVLSGHASAQAGPGPSPLLTPGGESVSRSDSPAQLPLLEDVA